MTLEYDVTLDDYVAYNVHHVHRSGTWRRMRRDVILWGTAILSAIAIAGCVLENTLLFLLMIPA